MWSRALLTKLIVRGLFLGNEPWKLLLQSDLATVTPTYGVRDGHIWTPGMRFLFTDAPVRRDGVSHFMRSLLQIWNSMRKGLIRRSPRCREEIERQPLIWNSYVYSTMDSHTGQRQQQLGERTHIDWAVWDAGPAVSYGTWCRERLLPVDTLAEHYHIVRGTRQRVVEIESAIPDAWDQVMRGSTSMPTHQGWWGYFDENGLAILVKYQYLLFTIAEDQDTSHHTRICFDFEDTSPILTGLAWVPIRVVGSCGARRAVDPQLEGSDATSWRLWIWDGRPISQLYWDPGEWHWASDIQGHSPVSFFEYTVWIGRYLQVTHQHAFPTRQRSWLHAGLSHAYILQFWSALWTLRVARKITYFHWLLTHGGLPVGSWAA
ncbi:hypothetical protein L7F22_045608 [Adiantum nelumboides]|nr:hypothetical protein [Adiantum nelumboides]